MTITALWSEVHNIANERMLPFQQAMSSLFTDVVSGAGGREATVPKTVGKRRFTRTNTTMGPANKHGAGEQHMPRVCDVTLYSQCHDATSSVHRKMCFLIGYMS